MINNLVNANQSSGYKSIQWNATNNQGAPVSAGVYLYTIEAGEFRQTKENDIIEIELSLCIVLPTFVGFFVCGMMSRFH